MQRFPHFSTRDRNRGLRRLTGWLAMLVLGTVMAHAATAGTVRQFTYPSISLGREQVAQIYVPDGEPPVGGWPVLYLLHGLDGTATDWEAQGKVQDTLDRLIAAHKIRPILVVMPAGANSWYVDSADVHGPGNYATAIGQDLPTAVEAAFPVGADRSNRAIAGLSMGGFGALRLGLAKPERYAAVAAMSPAIWQNLPIAPDGVQPSTPDPQRALYFRKSDPADVTIGLDLPPDGSHFGSAFGTPFDPHRFNAANVFTLLQQAVDSKKALPSIFLTVGDDDSHLLWRGAIAFFETMQMDRRDMEFRVTDGDHNWTCWRASLADALVFIDAHVGRRGLEKNAAR